MKWIFLLIIYIIKTSNSKCHYSVFNFNMWTEKKESVLYSNIFAHHFQCFLTAKQMKHRMKMFVYVSFSHGCLFCWFAELEKKNCLVFPYNLRTLFSLHSSIFTTSISINTREKKEQWFKLSFTLCRILICLRSNCLNWHPKSHLNKHCPSFHVYTTSARLLNFQ